MNEASLANISTNQSFRKLLSAKNFSMFKIPILAKNFKIMDDRVIVNIPWDMLCCASNIRKLQKLVWIASVMYDWWMVSMLLCWKFVFKVLFTENYRVFIQLQIQLIPIILLSWKAGHSVSRIWLSKDWKMRQHMDTRVHDFWIYFYRRKAASQAFSDFSLLILFARSDWDAAKNTSWLVAFVNFFCFAMMNMFRIL